MRLPLNKAAELLKPCPNKFNIPAALEVTMKHNERARVAPQDFFKDPRRAQNKTQRAHHAHAPWLGVWFACSLWSAFSVLARSLRSS